MFEKVEQIEKRYKELGEIISKPEIIQDYEKFRDLSKQRKTMEETVNIYYQYKEAMSAINEAKEMLHSEKDSSMREFLNNEISTNENKIAEFEQRLKVLLLPKDPMDDKDIMLEIRGSAGGDEANIFAGDLFRMYQRYAEKQGWKVEIINAEDSASGGFSQIEFLIKGKGVYSKLKYESGAHRVQRIPETESGGRIHTSTSTVIVMPEQENIEIEIKPEDIKIDVYRSGGAGGQSVNTTDSAVRMTHIPTGIVVTCQNERSQLQNKEKALQILKSKIYEEEKRKQEEESGMERRSKIGTGDRSEKIRTYNYPQNRVTDHRIGLTLNKLDRIIEGDLEEIIESLINEDQKRKLEESEN